MHYFTALGITVAIIGGIFLFLVLAVPIEVITMYFTAVVQVITGIVFATIYIASLQWLKKKSQTTYA